MSKANYVTASEIGEYTFCPRGWWLHYHGLLEVTPQMLAGTKIHDRLSQKVIWRRRLIIFAIILLIIGTLLLVYYCFKSSIFAPRFEGSWPSWTRTEGF